MEYAQSLGPYVRQRTYACRGPALKLRGIPGPPGRDPIAVPEVKVLLVAADPRVARTVERVLARGRAGAFHLEWVTRLPRDLDTLGLGETTVALLDLLSADVDGIGALDRLLQRAPHLPVLVFSEAGDEDLARQAVQRGAQDYLPRNRLDGYALPRALRHAIDRKADADALFVERERAQVTLDAIGEAVVSTDIEGNVAYLNSVAEAMTGWSRAQARGRKLDEVLCIMDAATRLPPEATLAPGSPELVLMRPDGVDVAIENSSAAIHGRDGGVIGAVIVLRDVGEARAAALRMSHRAQHDFLTDLPNPVLLDDRIAQAVALANRHGKQLAVLFVDLDDFKRINDTLGHAVGDKLLQSVALRLKACVRGSDTVSRKGGDEFVVLLSEIAQPEDAARGAEKIVAALAAAHRIAEHDIVVGASVGIAVYPLDGADARTLLERADASMYRAKEAYRCVRKRTE